MCVCQARHLMLINCSVARWIRAKLQMKTHNHTQKRNNKCANEIVHSHRMMKNKCRSREGQHNENHSNQFILCCLFFDSRVYVDFGVLALTISTESLFIIIINVVVSLSSLHYLILRVAPLSFSLFTFRHFARALTLSFAVRNFALIRLFTFFAQHIWYTWPSDTHITSKYAYI